jgi:hypothetical protein
LFSELVHKFFGAIDFTKSRIVFPRKLVFVCGGKSNGNESAPFSMRELLINHSSKTSEPGEFQGSRILFAEEAVNALADSHFENLLDLEEYIAAVVSNVLLIVESAGSICELGSFVKVEEISEKLVIVMLSDHSYPASFITSGALGYYNQYHDNPQVLGFSWKTSKAGVVSAAEYVLDKMVSDIPEAMTAVASNGKEEIFKKDNIGHRIYLVLAICHALRAAKFKEIKIALKASEVMGETFNENDIRRCLDILIICELLKPVKHGKLDYYVSQVVDLPLKISWKKGTADKDRDTLRWIREMSDAGKIDDKDRVAIFWEHKNAES